MGTVFKKRSFRPVPPDAEIVSKGGRRLARWTAKGKAKSAPVVVTAKGVERIVTESATYFAKYRDGGGTVRLKATGCRDERAAKMKLSELERTAERVRIGVATAAESSAGECRRDPFAQHLDDYLTYLELDGACKAHRGERKRQLERLATACDWHTLGDLDAGPLAVWLTQQARAEKKMAARTRNTYLGAALAFANWAVEYNRLNANPFARVPKADESADVRRQRRALTEAELTRLLIAASRRPLDDARTVPTTEKRKPRKDNADLKPATVERLTLIGRERALIYKTLVLTGLRRGELASLTVGQLFLDDDPAYAELAAADSKNRERATLPLRADLAADLRSWLAQRLTLARVEACDAGQPVPLRLDAGARLFDVPGKLCKILERDLKAAGIAKRDDRGRVIDVHALRHSFGTLLSKGGVAPRTAQAAMRHSKIDLTMNVYTDPRLLDVGAALDTLPGLPLPTPGAEPRAARATGTDGSTVAPTVAPTRHKSVRNKTPGSNSADPNELIKVLQQIDVTSYQDTTKKPLTTTVSGSHGVGVIGLEPMTPSLSSGGQSLSTPTIQANSDTSANGCTNGCTCEPVSDPVDALAAALFALPDADRRRLAAMLTGSGEGGG